MRRFRAWPYVLIAFVGAAFAPGVSQLLVIAFSVSQTMSATDWGQELLAAVLMMLVLQAVAAIPVSLIPRLRTALERSLRGALSVALAAAVIYGAVFTWLMSGKVPGPASPGHGLTINALWLLSGVTSGAVFHLFATRRSEA